MNTQMPQLRKPTPPKPCLNKIDALEYAADRMEKSANDLEFASMIVNLMGRDKLLSEARGKDDEMSKTVIESLEAMVEPELQVQAFRDAAKQIRDFVLEEKILQARVQTANIGKA